MLTNLSIRDIVLIEKLDVELATGLTVLTGETGAGKSIVLDCLALALGARSEKGLVRPKADFGSVSARFEPPDEHPAFTILESQGIRHDGEIVLRRQIQPDGRSRSYVNNETVSAGLLRELGTVLVEVHGQMDQHGLMDSKTHTALLDLIGGHHKELQDVAQAGQHWATQEAKLQSLIKDAERTKSDADYLQHRLTELTALAPEVGEENRLAEERSNLQNREKLLELLNEIDAVLNGDGGVIERLGACERRIARASDATRQRLDSVFENFGRALIELTEAGEFIATTQAATEQDANQLDRVEDRLFALKDAARKYRVETDRLPELLEQTRAAIDAMQTSDDAIASQKIAVDNARDKYLKCAKRLSVRREQSAKSLTTAIMAEFPPLKLDRARFRVRLEQRDNLLADPNGLERAIFEISTNPGQDFGALGKIASGGELSRLMLALKVVLSRTQTTHSMVFDEVDSGVGGATAAAVGDRLAKLATNQQVLVVTHAPQVAARAHHHMVVAKLAGKSRTDIRLRELSKHERLDEIARMLSGEEVTSEAKAAAAKLLNHEPA